MKKIVSYLALLSVLTSMTACNSIENVSYNNAVTAGIKETVITTAVTTNVSQTSVISETTVTSEAAETAAAVTEYAANTTAAQTLTPVEEKTTAVQNLPVITSAELVAVYNDYGDGYMYRLDMDGNYEYWNADLKGISASQDYSRSISSNELRTDYPLFVTGGSTITELTAVVTPYDQNGNAGSPVTVVWDRNRVEHEAVRIFGNDHDTANLFGFYPYSEKLREKIWAGAGYVSLESIEGEWMHGQYTLHIFDCDKTVGRFEDANESGTFSGTVRLEYTIEGYQTPLWYTLYTDDGILYKAFRASYEFDVNEFYEEGPDKLIYTRLS